MNNHNLMTKLTDRSPNTKYSEIYVNKGSILFVYFLSKTPNIKRREMTICDSMAIKYKVNKHGLQSIRRSLQQTKIKNIVFCVLLFMLIKKNINDERVVSTLMIFSHKTVNIIKSSWVTTCIWSFRQFKLSQYRQSINSFK